MIKIWKKQERIFRKKITGAMQEILKKKGDKGRLTSIDQKGNWLFGVNQK